MRGGAARFPGDEAELEAAHDTNRAKVDVSVPGRCARRRPGIDVHVTSTLTGADITTVHGIPCTIVAALVDLGDVAPERAVEQAVDQAEVLRLFDGRAVEDAIERAGPADGVSYKADFLWRTEWLIVETDSRRFHSHRKAFEHDRLRDQRLTLAGYTVVRFTWRQVADDPRAVAEALRGLLARLARP